MKKIGIYALWNKKSGKVYIGQSRDLERRKYDHFRSLNKGIHHNLYLQRSYNTDGAENFHYVVMEECPLDKLNEREVFWINKLQTMDIHLGYNLEGGGNQDKIISERTKECKKGKNNPMYGKKISKAHVEALRIKNRCHGSSLDEEKVKQIKLDILNGKTLTEVAKKFDVSKAVVCKIKTGKNFSWVSPELNKFISDEYIKKTRNENIIKLANEGLSRHEIARRLKITPRTVANVVGEPSKWFKKNR